MSLAILERRKTEQRLAEAERELAGLDAAIEASARELDVQREAFGELVAQQHEAEERLSRNLEGQRVDYAGLADPGVGVKLPRGARPFLDRREQLLGEQQPIQVAVTRLEDQLNRRLRPARERLLAEIHGLRDELARLDAGADDRSHAERLRGKLTAA